jgi:hypothetical protein
MVEDAVWKAPAIGRIYSISPRQGDCYYVQLLLTEVRGPSSFTAPKTVDGQELSFRKACLARGLLENDQNLHLAMEEAGVSQSAPNIRSLLAVILTTCLPSNPCTLWQQFRDLLSEDFLFQHRRNVNNPEVGYNEEIYNNALCSLEDKEELLVTETDNLQQQLTDDQHEVYNSFLELLEQGSINNRNIIFLDALEGQARALS